MRQINVNSGRLLQRRVSDGEYLLGLVHLDPNAQIQEGADYLLMLENQQSTLLELPAEHSKTINSAFQNQSIDDILCSQTWRKTTTPTSRIVRLLKQFDDSNGWLVFGPHPDSGVESDRWFDVHHNHLNPIEEPIATMGDKALGLARQPIWPHPNGELYTMVPNYPLLSKSIAGATQFRMLGRDHYGFDALFNYKNKNQPSAFQCHPFWSEHCSTQKMDDYGNYLHILHDMGLLSEERPMSATEHAAREKITQQAVKNLVEEMHHGALRNAQHKHPLPLEQRKTILQSSSDPIECANALFEAVLDNDASAAHSQAWRWISIDHVLLCAAPAFAHSNYEIVERIATTLNQSSYEYKDEAFLQLTNTAGHLKKNEAQKRLLQQFVPTKLNQQWEMLAYDILPIDPAALRHWTPIFDQLMFENALAYTLNNQAMNMPWSEKLELIKDILNSTPFNWDQNKIFTRASYIHPVPSLQQWDELFEVCGAQPVPEKGLMKNSQESFNLYFEHVCARTQKRSIEEALSDKTIQAPKKKM